MVEHPIERVRLSAPPGRDGRKLQFLAEQMTSQAGKERHYRRRLNQTAAQCVGHLHISSDDGVDEAGNAQKRIAPQFERIAKAIVRRGG